MRLMAGFLLAAICLAPGGAAAGPAKSLRGKEKPAASAAPTPDCARANYPGDPVCAWEDEAALPTPSARAVRREIPDDVMINDKMSVGSADPVAMAKPPAQVGNPYPVRKKEPVGGGAAVNYRF